jgi:hypothetical protein
MDQSTKDPNSHQVGGNHYKAPVEHWDFVWANHLDYFQGQITKYVARWKGKNGLQDLYKARHFLEKYINLVEKQQKDMQAPKRPGLVPEWPDAADDPAMNAVERMGRQRGDPSEPGRGYVNQG